MSAYSGQDVSSAEVGTNGVVPVVVQFGSSLPQRSPEGWVWSRGVLSVGSIRQFLQLLKCVLDRLSNERHLTASRVQVLSVRFRENRVTVLDEPSSVLRIEDDSGLLLHPQIRGGEAYCLIPCLDQPCLHQHVEAGLGGQVLLIEVGHLEHGLRVPHPHVAVVDQELRTEVVQPAEAGRVVHQHDHRAGVHQLHQDAAQLHLLLLSRGVIAERVQIHHDPVESGHPGVIHLPTVGERIDTNQIRERLQLLVRGRDVVVNPPYAFAVPGHFVRQCGHSSLVGQLSQLRVRDWASCPKRRSAIRTSLFSLHRLNRDVEGVLIGSSQHLGVLELQPFVADLSAQRLKLGEHLSEPNSGLLVHSGEAREPQQLSGVDDRCFRDIAGVKDDLRPILACRHQTREHPEMLISDPAFPAGDVQRIHRDSRRSSQLPLPTSLGQHRAVR